MRLLLLAGFVCITFLTQQAAAAEWTHEELRRFPAVEAKQGVAVDETFFYAITNDAIGKYRKDTGERVSGWEDEKNGPIQHLNAGIAVDGKLYCAHSNFPNVPEKSSMEVWDCATMKHEGSFPFNEPPGSLTWIDTRDETWYACFAHYKKNSDPALSQLVRYDAAGKELARWTFPPKLVERFGNYSASGGSFGPFGRLFVTGHDAKELYVMDMMRSGGQMIWLDTIPISAEGQAFAWDHIEGNEGILYSISRKTKEVIVSRIAEKAAGKSAEGEAKDSSNEKKSAEAKSKK